METGNDIRRTDWRKWESATDNKQKYCKECIAFKSLCVWILIKILKLYGIFSTENVMPSWRNWCRCVSLWLRRKTVNLDWNWKKTKQRWRFPNSAKTFKWETTKSKGRWGKKWAKVFLDASSHLYKRVCPSVCMSVRYPLSKNPTNHLKSFNNHPQSFLEASSVLLCGFCPHSSHLQKSIFLVAWTRL